jgi:glycosyltransferase involved in cell wall biosynthesis
MCLQSILDQSVRCELIVVDNFSTDATEEIATKMADKLILAGPERSAQRNIGARHSAANIFGFIDSDMSLERTVVEEVIALHAEGFDAIIVPEGTSGDSYWARVRAFERSFYEGHNEVEAARFYARGLYESLSGFDESMTGPEDWDMTIRARNLGQVGHTSSRIDHQEKYASYLEACRKKAYYAVGLQAFSQKHGKGRLFKVSTSRPYIRRPWLLLKKPRLGAGLLALKIGELVFVLKVLLATKLKTFKTKHQERRSLE